MESKQSQTQTDTRERLGDFRMDKNQLALDPLCRYAGDTLSYLFTVSEEDHGIQALDIAQSCLDEIRSTGELACCLHRGTEHHIYATGNNKIEYEVKGKHTPGKWRVSPFPNADDHGEYIEITTDYRESKDHINVIAKLYDRNYDKREPSANYSQDETNQLANAKLIAAAPEMLERLEYVVSWLEDAKVHKVIVDHCKATIKRATE